MEDLSSSDEDEENEESQSEGVAKSIFDEKLSKKDVGSVLHGLLRLDAKEYFVYVSEREIQTPHDAASSSAGDDASKNPKLILKPQTRFVMLAILLFGESALFSSKSKKKDERNLVRKVVQFDSGLHEQDVRKLNLHWSRAQFGYKDGTPNGLVHSGKGPGSGVLQTAKRKRGLSVLRSQDVTINHPMLRFVRRGLVRKPTNPEEEPVYQENTEKLAAVHNLLDAFHKNFLCVEIPSSSAGGDGTRPASSVVAAAERPERQCRSGGASPQPLPPYHAPFQDDIQANKIADDPNLAASLQRNLDAWLEYADGGNDAEKLENVRVHAPFHAYPYLKEMLHLRNKVRSVLLYRQERAARESSREVQAATVEAGGGVAAGAAQPRFSSTNSSSSSSSTSSNGNYTARTTTHASSNHNSVLRSPLTAAHPGATTISPTAVTAERGVATAAATPIRDPTPPIANPAATLTSPQEQPQEQTPQQGVPHSQLLQLQQSMQPPAAVPTATLTSRKAMANSREARRPVSDADVAFFEKYQSPAFLEKDQSSAKSSPRSSVATAAAPTGGGGGGKGPGGGGCTLVTKQVTATEVHAGGAMDSWQGSRLPSQETPGSEKGPHPLVRVPLEPAHNHSRRQAVAKKNASSVGTENQEPCEQGRPKRICKASSK
mmetsp:Transcript_85951/g.172055  ORF Transcript_85951/g.172055 Transcript_85951/m.172055 type:complete len:659 (-) Transcript_85951:225-2201(-)